jgi:hypothetical protein
VSDNSGADKGLLALIQGVLGTRHSTPPPEFEPPRDELQQASAEAAEPPQDAAGSPMAETVAVTEPDRPAETYDRRKTADELADIILRALQTLDGAPPSGFVVTVYGGNPWNAMLTIKPDAGPIPDPGLWRARVREMAARLRQDFDLSDS